MIFNKSSPELYARELLHSLDIKNIPVNPFEICDILHIDICYEPLRQSEAVLLIKNGSHRVILNQNISYQPRLKFTVAHEIGHFYIPCHDLQVFACQASDIMSFNTDRSLEQEANKFASELLMPTEYIQKEAKLHDYNAESVKKIADKFSVSITASAIRFLEFTPDKAAIVLSQNSRVKWFMKARNFRYHIKTGMLSEDTYVYDFFKYFRADESMHQTYAHAWIDGDFDIDFINEQSIFMPNLNMALTVLTIPYSEDDEYDDEWNY
ncbi:MAG TPA: ImmA/IrrE family metallo-endopeptidase [Clostridia bacterium]